MKTIDLQYKTARPLSAVIILSFLFQLAVTHAMENHPMAKPDNATDSSLPISGAQSYALTDAQRAEMTEKAEAGDAEAAFRLSLYCTFVSSDDAQRMRWLSIAAKVGHAVAQHNLAYDLYMNGKDLAEAAHWAEESLKNGNADAGGLLEEIRTARGKVQGTRP